MSRKVSTYLNLLPFDLQRELIKYKPIGLYYWILGKLELDIEIRPPDYESDTMDRDIDIFDECNDAISEFVREYLMRSDSGTVCLFKAIVRYKPYLLEEFLATRKPWELKEYATNLGILIALNQIIGYRGYHVFKYVIDKLNIIPNTNMLITAIEYKYIEIIHYLLDKDTELYTRTVCLWAIKHKRIDIVRYLHDMGYIVHKDIIYFFLKNTNMDSDIVLKRFIKLYDAGFEITNSTLELIDSDTFFRDIDVWIMENDIMSKNIEIEV